MKGGRGVLSNETSMLPLIPINGTCFGVPLRGISTFTKYFSALIVQENLSGVLKRTKGQPTAFYASLPDKEGTCYQIM